MYAEQAALIRVMQTFISSKDISTALSTPNCIGGAERDRTADPLLAKQVLSQLSYSPIQVAPQGFNQEIRQRLNHKSIQTIQDQQLRSKRKSKSWWARVDSNYRPHAYQACALTN